MLRMKLCILAPSIIFHLLLKNALSPKHLIFSTSMMKTMYYLHCLACAYLCSCANHLMYILAIAYIATHIATLIDILYFYLLS